jgi:hypothetical protein
MKGSPKLHTKTNDELITAESSERQGKNGGSGCCDRCRKLSKSPLEKASRRTVLCTAGKPHNKRLSSRCDR